MRGAKKAKPRLALRPTGVQELIGRRPTLPHTCACSTIGAERLNFRVRDGNGWNPLAGITRKLASKSRGTQSTKIRELISH